MLGKLLAEAFLCVRNSPQCGRPNFELEIARCTDSDRRDCADPLQDSEIRLGHGHISHRMLNPLVDRTGLGSSSVTRNGKGQAGNHRCTLCIRLNLKSSIQLS